MHELINNLREALDEEKHEILNDADEFHPLFGEVE